jgi:hypothetical protein
VACIGQHFCFELQPGGGVAKGYRKADRPSNLLTLRRRMFLPVSARMTHRAVPLAARPAVQTICITPPAGRSGSNNAICQTSISIYLGGLELWTRMLFGKSTACHRHANASDAFRRFRKCCDCHNSFLRTCGAMRHPDLRLPRITPSDNLFRAIAAQEKQPCEPKQPSQRQRGVGSDTSDVRSMAVVAAGALCSKTSKRTPITVYLSPSPQFPPQCWPLTMSPSRFGTPSYFPWHVARSFTIVVLPSSRRV